VWWRWPDSHRRPQQRVLSLDHVVALDCAPSGPEPLRGRDPRHHVEPTHPQSASQLAGRPPASVAAPPVGAAVGRASHRSHPASWNIGSGTGTRTLIVRVTTAYPTIERSRIIERGPATVLHRTSHRNGATQRGRSAAASSRTMKHGAAATGRRPLVPTAWLEQAMPPLGDGSFTGCWTSTRHFVGILLGTVPERLPRRRAAPQVARAGPSQKKKGSIVKVRRSADRFASRRGQSRSAAVGESGCGRDVGV
jgi:hypothetical protein